MPEFSFAARESEFRPSPVRAVFELALDPAYVSLAGGNPDTSMLPGAELAEVADRLLRDRGAEVLQYGSGAGVTSLVPTIDALMSTVGAHADASTTLVTTGSQMGIDLATKLFCDPGDVVLAEGPTYVGALGVFGAYQVDLRQVPVRGDAMDPHEVATRLDELAAAGTPARFVYCIPHHQNPGGTTMGLGARRGLVRVCAERGVPIVEDDPYALVGFPGTDPLPSMYSMNPDGVIYLGSMSKLFSPGMRVGWMCAPAAVRARLQIAGESVDIHPSVLSQEVTAQWVGSPRWREVLDAQRTRYAERCARMLDALETAGLPGDVTWTRPCGGFFSWLTLPGIPTSTDLLQACVEHRVIAVPGNACYATTPERSHLRLAFSNASDDELAEGVRRVATTIDDLYS